MYVVIDIGSNTVRFVLYKLEGKEIHSVLNKKAAIGLAGYIDASGNLSPSGVDRLLECLTDFSEILSCIQYKKLYVFATASLRHVKNSSEVLALVEKRLDFKVEILSGEEEARLDYYGAKKEMPYPEGLVVDVGGGSTELVFFRGDAVLSAVSLPVGSMNLYTDFCEGLFPTQSEMEKISFHVKDLLEKHAAKSGEFSATRMVSVGGSGRGVYHYIQKKKKIAVMGREYPVGHLDVLLQAACGSQKRYTKTILKVAADRIHTFTPGLLVLRQISAYYGVSSIVSSDYGVREGYLLQALEQEGVL